MAFDKFRLKIIFRILPIAFFMLAFFYSIGQDKWYVTSASCILIIIILLIELIYFLEATKRELSKFLMSVRQKDFSIHYHIPNKKNTSFDLNKIFKEISDEFQNVRIEKEIHYQYLQTVFSHSKTAIICFNEEGDLLLINEAFKKMVSLNHINNLNKLSRKHPQLLEAIKTSSPRQEKLVKLRTPKGIFQLSLQTTFLKLKNERYKMISLHDVKNVLEEQELDSWKKLIRVLNHEIMNSVTPISSLSKALNKMLEHSKTNLKDLAKDDQEDLIESLKTIENRSNGLLNFVTNYKKITKLPQPNYTQIKVKGLIKHIVRLLKSKLDEKNIEYRINCQENMEIFADHELTEQVIINLLLNAIQALDEQHDKKISIRAYQNENNNYIEIEDNGPGIPDEILDQIFIPFFTTKKEGSGIGLSLSKQIMQLHRGNLSVNSTEGLGSTFILRFP